MLQYWSLPKNLFSEQYYFSMHYLHLNLFSLYTNPSYLHFLLQKLQSFHTDVVVHPSPGHIQDTTDIIFFLTLEVCMYYKTYKTLIK